MMNKDSCLNLSKNKMFSSKKTLKARWLFQGPSLRIRMRVKNPSQ